MVVYKVMFYKGMISMKHKNIWDAYCANKIDRTVWEKLSCQLKENGHYEEAVLFDVLLLNYKEEQEDNITITLPNTERAREYMRLGLVHVSHTPLNIEIIDAKGESAGKYYCSGIGKFLPGELLSSAEYRYFNGVFNQGDFLNVTAQRIEDLDRAETYFPFRYDNIPFDVMRAKKVRKLSQSCGGKIIVLPVAGTVANQGVKISNGKEERTFILGKYEFRMIRLNENVGLSSEFDFLCGEPIVLEHSNSRHKLVLNILLDSLSYAALAQREFQDIPNIMKFFKRGIIFENAYCPAEYTFPSLNCMSTGMYMHNSGIIDERIYAPYSGKVKTISEQMKAQGYYCVNVMGGGRGVMTGSMNGFDRHIINPYLNDYTHEGVRRTIDHLEAFNECDNYLLLHINDAHPVGADAQLSLPTQTKTNWLEIGGEQISNTASVRLASKDFYLRESSYMVQRMDEELGILFNYLETHYDENEYVVNVFSDHGASIFTNENYLFKETQCHVAMMCRGAGISAMTNSYELINGLDLYAIMAKECGFLDDVSKTDANLPEIFGGQAREIVYSNSIFPGQSYKLCMRTKDFECRVESKEPVKPNGTWSLDGCKFEIYRRDEKHELLNDKELEIYFRDKMLCFLGMAPNSL